MGAETPFSARAAPLCLDTTKRKKMEDMSNENNTQSSFLPERGTLGGAHIAITGAMANTRSEVVSIIQANGGIYDTVVKHVTDYLVEGVLRPTVVIPDGRSKKLRRAEQLQAAGGHIRIITQEDFYRLLEGEKI